jgi:hypothetical protein
MSDASKTNLDWVKEITDKIISSKQKFKPIKKKVQIELPRGENQSNSLASLRETLHTQRKDDMGSKDQPKVSKKQSETGA